MPLYPENKRVYIVFRISSILDVTDPYNPVEIARFSNTDLEFE